MCSLNEKPKPNKDFPILLFYSGLSQHATYMYARLRHLFLAFFTKATHLFKRKQNVILIQRKLINKVTQPCSEKTYFSVYMNNKGADQTAHLRSLIRTIVVHCLNCITSRFHIENLKSLAWLEKWVGQLVSDQIGNLKSGFLVTGL